MRKAPMTANWRLALNIIIELGPYKGDGPLGITTRDIVKHIKVDKPDITDAAARTAISHAFRYYLAPISKVRAGRGMAYYVALGDRKKARAISADKNPVSSRNTRRQGVKKPASHHPSGANNPPPMAAHTLQVPQGAPAQKKSRFTAPKNTPAPRAIRSENCLYLIQARAPRSLSCEDIADFFFISLEEAAQVLTAAAAKYGHLVEITMHARIKKQ